MLGTIILLLIIILLLGVILFFTPTANKNQKPTEEINNWEYQKEQAKRESEAEKNKEWFSKGRWLTDKEIDWACERMPKDKRFKILPAHQFHYVREVTNKKEIGADLAFKELLKEITTFNGELVFIPINNPNFHWSLLVFEVKNKCFYHWDTLKGANWSYAKDTVYELLKGLKVPRHLWDKHFLARHKIRQNNGSDCGVAVISFTRKIREKLNPRFDFLGEQKYSGDLKNLGTFDFGKERERLREEYLTEIK